MVDQLGNCWIRVIKHIAWPPFGMQLWPLWCTSKRVENYWATPHLWHARGKCQLTGRGPIEQLSPWPILCLCILNSCRLGAARSCSLILDEGEMINNHKARFPQIEVKRYRKGHFTWKRRRGVRTPWTRYPTPWICYCKTWLCQTLYMTFHHSGQWPTGQIIIFSSTCMYKRARISIMCGIVSLIAL